MGTIRYAIIGCGVVARKHLKGARYHQNKRRTLEIVAAVDTRPGAAEKIFAAAGFNAKEIARLAIYEDYQKMLSEVRPDLVVITTPSGSHASISLAALAAGAHVLIEKPLTLSLEQADEILEVARKSNRKVAVGHIYRFFPLVQAIRSDILSGRFGQVLYGDVKVRWGHAQAYYDQAAWRGTWSQDGGALMNQSVHAMDLMTWLLGQAVESASGQIFRKTHHMEAEDLGFAILTLANDVQCLVEGTTITDPKRPQASFFIRLTEGEIQAGIVSGKPFISVYDKTGKNLASAYTRRIVWQTLRQSGFQGLRQLANPHSGLLGDLISAIEENREPLANGQSGRDAVALVLAIYQSALEKKIVRLPLKAFDLTRMQHFFS
ncbi:MAG: Gfo/Idh/MocA family oxidoreductase [Eubacteriales bacterium]|nr:Gfo/Idh/MocA family oxidoreductase [Eubacteriales bacterium]